MKHCSLRRIRSGLSSAMDHDTRWKFDDIRQLAIKESLGHKIESVQKIELEHKYNVQRQWAYEAYIDLCSRRSPLTSNEAKRLGIETATLVNQARERERNQKTWRGWSAICFNSRTLQMPLAACSESTNCGCRYEK